VDTQVLKAVVKYDNIGAQMANGMVGGYRTPDTGNDHGTGKILRQQPRFVARVQSAEEDILSIGDHIDLFPRPTAVAAAEDCRVMAMPEQYSCYMLYQWSLPGTPQNNIAHTDDRDRKLMLLENSVSIQGGPHSHDEGVEWRENAARDKNGLCCF
jgi:hypothetical protein